MITRCSFDLHFPDGLSLLNLPPRGEAPERKHTLQKGQEELFRPAVLSTSPGRALGLEANTERLHEFTEKYLDDSDLGTTTEPKPR